MRRFAIGFRVYASVYLNIVVLYQRVLCTLDTRTMMKPRLLDVCTFAERVIGIWNNNNCADYCSVSTFRSTVERVNFAKCLTCTVTDV